MIPPGKDFGFSDLIEFSCKKFPLYYNYVIFIFFEHEPIEVKF
jgi:hypothetical protein